MSADYLAPLGCGEAELVEKRSRFLARVWPAGTEAEALAHIADMRKQHWDASHNVYAYLLREGGLTRYSDDGEPGGTAGMPVLNVFRGAAVQNVCCVVTRYFGGTLLGTGGLVRAYGGAAKLALDAAGIARCAPWRDGTLTCTYAQYERLRRFLEERGALLEDAAFGELVTLRLSVPAGEADAFAAALRDHSASTVAVAYGEERFRASPEHTLP